MHKTPTSRGETSAASEYNQKPYETGRLSKLPRLAARESFAFDKVKVFDNSVVASVCAGCGGRLDLGDNFHRSIHCCRKCIGIYARIDLQIEESAKRKKKELLERFVPEVTR